MPAKHTTPEERYNLILECRSSGLTDYQWCQENGIKIGTFYNWISRLRKQGYPDIPKPLGREHRHRPNVQEVVRVDVTSDTAHVPPAVSLPAETCITSAPVIEISTGRVSVRISNGADANLLRMVLASMGGMP